MLSGLPGVADISAAICAGDRADFALSLAFAGNVTQLVSCCAEDADCADAPGILFPGASTQSAFCCHFSGAPAVP